MEGIHDSPVSEQGSPLTQQTSSPPETELDFDQILRDLDAATDHFPEAALRACQQHREFVVPRLIDVLHEAARLGRQGIVREGQVPFYALFLLNEFRATEALPALFDVITIEPTADNDIPDKLFGDAITEMLTRLLATLADDHLDLLDSLIRNPGLNDFVRWSALDAFAMLVRDQRLDHQAIVNRLQRHLQDAIARKDSWAATVIISTLVSLKATNSLPDIERTFELNLVDESVVSRECVKQSFYEDPSHSFPELNNLRPTRIEDCVEELRGWHWAGDDEVSPGPHEQEIDLFADISEPDNDTIESLLPDEDDEAIYETTIRNDTPRVGRNDLCPCGSGKKYKKCCLRNAAN